MVGLAGTHHEYGELQYWFGPHFTDDISSMPLGVTRHEASDDERYFAGVSRTEFWWYEQKGARTFECEELQNIPSYGIGGSEFGCRFAHSITADDHKTFQHIDGAIRLYDESSMIQRLEVDLKTAGRKTKYTKLWRVDGTTPVTTWKRLISDYYRDNTLIGEYLGGKDPILDEHRKAADSEAPTATIFDYVPSRMTVEDGVNLSVSYHPRRLENKSSRIVRSFDTLSNDSVRYRYIESDALEVIKALKRAGHVVEMEDGLVRVLFEDDVLNLPIFTHTGQDSVKTANDTVSAIAGFLRRLGELNIDKEISGSIEVNYEEHAVFYSFAGKSQNVLEWLTMSEAQFPQRITDVPEWCERASGALSKRFQSQKCGDMLWQTLKESGLLKFDRKFLRPDKFRTQVVKDGAPIIRADIPKEDVRIFESHKITLGRVMAIRNSECTKCGKAYDECLHSKYLDEGVIHRITSVDLLAVFWSERTEAL
jgi:hypothetical protein